MRKKEIEDVDAYPLTWPDGYGRTKEPQRSRFRDSSSFGYVRDGLQQGLLSWAQSRVNPFQFGFVGAQVVEVVPAEDAAVVAVGEAWLHGVVADGTQGLDQHRQPGHHRALDRPLRHQGARRAHRAP